MEIWILLYKLVLVTYFIMSYIEDKIFIYKNTTIIVLFLLVYISLNIGKAILSDIRIKRIITFVSLILCILCYIFVSTRFIIFVPFNIIEINEGKISIDFLTVAFVGISVLFVKTYMISEFFLFYFCGLIIYQLVTKTQSKISNLTHINDSLRRKNEKLLLSKQNDEEYESQVIYTSKLEERNKIAQEIHDKLGHTISANIMQLEAAKLLFETQPDKSKAMIQSSVDALRSGMESIRSTLRSIKPPKEQIGINKVKLLVDNFSKTSGVNSNFFYEGNIDIIAFAQWKILYDNINEALTNVMKYSKARNVWVKVQVLNKIIKAEVKDDGKGCVKYCKGLGIMGMEERTESINGKVIIDGSDGFSVIILLPIL